MARYRIKSTKSVVVEYKGGGVVSGSIVWTGKKSSFKVSSPKLAGVSADVLQDFSDAVLKACKHIASMTKKNISIAGRRMDPDEPTYNPGEDCKVVYKIFKNDPRFELSFTRYAADGQVKADLQAFNWTDFPSAVQVAAVCVQAANLMAEYSEIE